MSKELSRRDFLKGAAATAVSAAFLGVTGAAAPKAKAAASYIPGTYTATATGMGEVTMTATFSENAITDIVQYSARDSVVNDLQNGKDETVDELLDTMQKLIR